jgi:hypothetical protein
MTHSISAVVRHLQTWEGRARRYQIIVDELVADIPGPVGGVYGGEDAPARLEQAERRKAVLAHLANAQGNVAVAKAELHRLAVLLTSLTA